ncbi:MAG: DMT family transporter [Candidatus Bathyarchaeia archaeon]
MIGEFSALAAALSWTVSAVLYKRVLATADPLAANTLRCIGTGLVLVLVSAFLWTMHVRLELQLYAVFLACASGVVGLGLGDTFYMLSLRTLGVSIAVPITCAYPLFNIVWAYLLVGETVTFQTVAGAFVIVFGAWLLSLEKPVASAGKHESMFRLKGLVYAFSAALAWSISISMVNLALKSFSSIGQAFFLNVFRVVAAAFTLLFFSVFKCGVNGFAGVGWKNFAMLLAGGLVAAGVGWFLLAYSLTLIPEAQAVPISSTTPLFSTLVSLVFLHEKATVKVALGSVMVVAGIFMVFMA